MMSRGEGPDDQSSDTEPGRIGRPWRAEDLLRAVVEGDAGGARPRIERFLDEADGAGAVITLTDADRTISVRIGGGSDPDAGSGLEPAMPPVAVPNHELLACIGRGGFGQVWLARHTLTEHFRACKLVPAARSLELDGVRRLKQRVPTHPNLFPIEEVGSADGWLYCLMPLADPDGVEGTAGTLADTAVATYVPLTLRRRLRDSGRLPASEVARVGLDLLAGLEHLHEHGVTHGDIKPANILRLGGRWTLADYGLLRNTGDEAGPAHTPGFVPPEGPGTSGADLFALGVVLMMMGTGARTTDLSRFLGGTGPLLEGVDRRIERSVRLLVSTDPEARAACRDEAAGLLRAIVEPKRPAAARASVVVGGLLGAGAIAGAAFGILRPAQVGTPPDPAMQRAMEVREKNLRMDAEITNSRATIDDEDGVPVVAAAPDPAGGIVFEPKIATGSFSAYAITEDGRVIGWGYDHDGALAVPKGIVNPVRVTTNGPAVFVLQADGRIVTWGHEDRHGEASPPADLPPCIDVAATFQRATLAVLPDGRLRGWGLNWNCMGPGTGLLDRLAGIRSVERVSGENGHWVGLTEDGEFVGGGCGVSGQLSPPPFAAPAKQALAAESWSCILDAEGVIHTFGYRTTQWLVAPEEPGFEQVAVGSYFGLGLHSSGRIVHWGDNRKGQADIPAGLKNVVAVAAARDNGIAIHADGTLTIWGDNEHGMLDWPSHERIRLGDPDLDANGVADWIDILRGHALDENADGVPDHAQDDDA